MNVGLLHRYMCTPITEISTTLVAMRWGWPMLALVPAVSATRGCGQVGLLGESRLRFRPPADAPVL